ncbi:MAG: ELWxxDGT repeat protein [Chloroflexota bacterium]
MKNHLFYPRVIIVTLLLMLTVLIVSQLNAQPIWSFKTYDLAPDGEYSIPDHMIEHNGRLVFRAAYDDMPALYQFQNDDGTFTTFGVSETSDRLYEFVSVIDQIFYSVDNYLVDETTVWVSSGTLSSTTPIQTFSLDGNSSPIRNLHSVDGILYFTVEDANHGNEVWRTDGTLSGTYLIADINEGSDSSIEYSSTSINWNGVLYFSADDGEHGYELVKVDPQTGNYELVKDINTGEESSSPDRFYIFNNHLYFVANDGAHGVELWRTDGTTEGTQLVHDINEGPEGADPGLFASLDNALYFSAYTEETGYELWGTDGTSEGTTLVKDIYPGTENGFYHYDPSVSDFMIAFDNALYFAGSNDDLEVWRSDGTLEGTELFANINVDRGSRPRYFTEHLGVVYFSATHADYGRRLWAIFPASPAPTLVDAVDINSSSTPSHLTSVGADLFFDVFNGDAGFDLGHLEVVSSPQEATIQLQSDIQQLSDDGDLTQRQANRLRGNLQNVLNRLDRGQDNRAIDSLNRFITLVERYETFGYLSANQADDLVNDAEGIIELID